MKREIVITNDGSSSIHLPDLNESYHSKHGAVVEAQHVFIQNGLDLIDKNEVSILEIGFGTGLNSLITCLEAKKRKLQIKYVGIEAYPVSSEELSQLNYSALFSDRSGDFDLIHSTEWNVCKRVNDFFQLTKSHSRIEDISYVNQFDLIYFDAFGFRVQPELWSEVIFKKMFDALLPKGMLTTYAARGPIKRAMQFSGFDVKKRPGPPGKREMMQGFKGNW